MKSIDVEIHVNPCANHSAVKENVEVNGSHDIFD